MCRSYVYGTVNKPTKLPFQLKEDLHLLVQPEEVKGVRPSKGSLSNEKEVLIQWKGLTEFEATLED